jgi:hypothetical protein
MAHRGPRLVRLNIRYWRKLTMIPRQSKSLALRQWARSDAGASAAVESVDAARLSNVSQLYRGLGWSAEEARARAVLFYAFIFGQSLIFLGPSVRKRASMTASCADILIHEAAFDDGDDCT